MEVVKANLDTLKQMPNFYDLINRYFQTQEVEVYACKVGDNYLGFLILNGIDGLYADNFGYRQFTTDLDLNLMKYVSPNYEAFFPEKDNPNYVANDKKEYTLGIEPLDEIDDEGYTGEVYFNQYNPETDTFIQICYPQMFSEINGHARIYSYHTQVPSRFFLETERKYEHQRKFGLVSKHITNINSFVFERGEIGYTITVMNEHGVLNTLMNSTYAYEVEDKIKRFTKAAYVFNDEYKDLWPVCRLYTQEEVNQMIRDAGFMVSVPEEIINIYDGIDKYLGYIREVLSQLKEKELRDSTVMKLTLVHDEEK